MTVARLETRDEEAPSGATRDGRLRELYVRHAAAAATLAYFLTGDRDAAEDLVQEAFVRVAGRFRYLRVPDAFDAYLRRTILNLFASHLRRVRLERRELARQRSQVSTEHLDADPAERDAVWKALQNLPPRQRAAIVLRYYEDLSERQTADALRCSVGAAKQLIARGLAGLRVEIGSED